MRINLHNPYRLNSRADIYQNAQSAMRLSPRLFGGGGSASGCGLDESFAPWLDSENSPPPFGPQYASLNTRALEEQADMMVGAFIQALRRLIALLVRCFLIGIGLPAYSGGDANYAISGWHIEHGLPQNFIRDVLQSKDGYLWISSLNSVVRFDGLKFTIFDGSNTPELSNKLISRIFEDSRGRLWVGHEAGEILVYADGRFCQLALPQEWPVQPIDHFAEDRSGRMWVLNREGGLVAIDPLKPEEITKPGAMGRPLIRDQEGRIFGTTVQVQQQADGPLIRDQEGRIWIRKGLPGDQCQFQTSDTAPPEATPPVASIAQAFASRKGGIWVAEEAHLRRWYRGQWHDTRRPFPVLGTPKQPLLETQNGQLLAGSFQDGLYIQQQDGTLTHLTTATGLAHNRVHCLSEDGEGNLWVGTGGGGLNMLRPRRVEMLNSPVGWLGLSVLAAAPNEEGGLWIATEGAGIYRWGGPKVPHLSHDKSLPTGVFVSLLPRNNSIWLGSWGEGLLLLSNNVPTPVPENSQIPRNVVCLYADRMGRTWVGTTAGLGCLAEGRYTKYDVPPPQQNPTVRCITESVDGTIWFGTRGRGLCRLLNGVVTRFGKADGLAWENVVDLWTAPNGTLWAATYGGGLSRFKDGKFAWVTKHHGLPSNEICSMQEDRQGRLWMSSSSGIFGVDMRALDQCADGITPVLNCVVYDRSDGLGTLDFGTGQAARCRLMDGRLCFVARTGVAIVDTAQAKLSTEPPPVIIEEFLVDGRPVPLRESRDENISSPSLSREPHFEKVKLQPGERWVEVRFTGINFASPQRVQFRYRLDGLDKQWTYAESRRSVDYRRLPPGNYVFRVSACNNGGSWNSSAASLSFTLPPQFWQTWWFSVSCWLMGPLVLTAGAMAVMRRSHRRKFGLLQRQRALEHERARIAQDIHDELGANLTRIVMISQSADAKLRGGQTPEGDLKTILTSAQDITRSLDEIVWAINPNHDSLASLAAYLSDFAREFLEPTGVQCELNFSLSRPERTIPAQARHDLFLAFKEALNNVVKHATANTIVVSLEQRHEQLLLCIRDDGRGFDCRAPGVRSAINGPKCKGNGLENIARRIKANGGICEVESAPGQGTRMRFSIPMTE